ncbi:MAG: hypothetical protein CHACPFDD_00614 [Phycisphaerae bacterium]|nr:hypothetical protein [Phycisphaerae bacterium]
MMLALFTVIVVLGALGVYLALPRGRAHPGRAPLLVLAAAAGLLAWLVVSVSTGGGPRAAFVVLSTLALAGAVRVITHRRPVYSALYFILVIVAVAGLLVLMGAEFLAASLVIIYAGAILVTYVFVIMLAQQPDDAPCDVDAREPLWAAAAGFALLAAIGSQLFGPVAIREPAAPVGDNVALVGTVLLTRYAVAVELAGVLLLAAMIGAIAIARRRVTSEEA